MISQSLKFIQKAKKVFLFSIFLIFPLIFNAYPIFQQVQKIEDAQIRQVAISPLNPNLIYVASSNALYRSRDEGKSFKKMHVFTDEGIVHIFFDPYLANTLYLAAERNFYKITNEKERLFACPQEATILSAGKLKGRLYVGTSDGVYSATQDLLQWTKLKRLGDGASVYYIESTKDKLLFSTSRGVYLFKSEEKIDRIFVTRESEAEGEEERTGLIVNSIKEDILDKKKIWLGTSQGLFTSGDGGKRWKKIYIAGFNNLPINCLAQTKQEKDAIYVGSGKGLFRVDSLKKTAKHIFEGLHTSNISWIEFTPGGLIYLATPKGLFESSHLRADYEGADLDNILKNEPSIGDIQQASLKYNDVHPNKIRQWKKSLRYRALFPSLNLDYDKTFTYDTGLDKYVAGPRDWGIGLQWDIEDLIWDSNETSIDSRSRLNTQLRLDILDEINRVYFERLRLKKELTNSSLSQRDFFKRKLRLSELTAILDGYTGGYFSHRTEELNVQ